MAAAVAEGLAAVAERRGGYVAGHLGLGDKWPANLFLGAIWPANNFWNGGWLTLSGEPTPGRLSLTLALSSATAVLFEGRQGCGATATRPCAPRNQRGGYRAARFPLDTVDEVIGSMHLN